MTPEETEAALEKLLEDLPRARLGRATRAFRDLVAARALRIGELGFELLELAWQITKEAPFLVVLVIALVSMILASAHAPAASSGVCP